MKYFHSVNRLLRINRLTQGGKVIVFSAMFSVAILSALAETTNYQSPVDGNNYRADWHRYSPTNSASTNAIVGRVQKQEIRLLSTQEVFARNVEVSELANYIKATEQQIDKTIGSTNDAFALMVKTTLSKDKKPDFKIASSPDTSHEVLQKIHDGLTQMPDFRSKSDEVSYEVRYSVAKKP
jgi:hypothetical protein